MQPKASLKAEDQNQPSSTCAPDQAKHLPRLQLVIVSPRCVHTTHNVLKNENAGQAAYSSSI